MEQNKFPIKGDLGKSFEKFKSSPLVRGCLIYKEGNLCRWGNFVGTKSEIEARIKEAGMHLQNSIKNKTYE